MTQEDKELLLKDLSGRLPYGLMLNFGGTKIDFTLRDIMLPLSGDKSFIAINGYDIEVCKPYLRPMSSMTEEERKEYNEVIAGMTLFEKEEARVCPYLMPVVWLLKKHFDVCGLLPKDLAVEAPVGMYKTE